MAQVKGICTVTGDVVYDVECPMEEVDKKIADAFRSRDIYIVVTDDDGSTWSPV